jgi:phosphoglycolate phosphatase-like HAD superfamily hydrolase
MPRMSGARAALEHLGVPDIERRAEQYTAGKQEMIVELIEAGRFNAFPDALRFLLVVKGSGIRVPGTCFVVEDASSGVQAAKAGRMAALGVARLDDEAPLTEAGADLVVTTLDEVALEALSEGRLERRRVRMPA